MIEIFIPSLKPAPRLRLGNHPRLPAVIKKPARFDHRPHIPHRLQLMHLPVNLYRIIIEIDRATSPVFTTSIRSFRASYGYPRLPKHYLPQQLGFDRHPG
jgi:hypothetical protein